MNNFNIEMNDFNDDEQTSLFKDVLIKEKMFPVLSKVRTIAGHGYNRWLAPPAALAVHLCIGMMYRYLFI